MQFEWDKNKNRSNKTKHGISFELACFVFEDPFILSIPDHRFHYSEPRWQSIGLVKEMMIYVAHTVGENEHDHEIIRIISARKSTSSEAKRYQNNRSYAERACST